MLCAAKIEKVTFNRLLKHKIVRVINKRSRWLVSHKLWKQTHAWLRNGPMSIRSKYCKQFLNSFILSFSFSLSTQDNFVAFPISRLGLFLFRCLSNVVHWSRKRNKAIFHLKWERNFAANECIWNVINSCPACMQMTWDLLLRHNNIQASLGDTFANFISHLSFFQFNDFFRGVNKS